jgi:hypothetical protein
MRRSIVILMTAAACAVWVAAPAGAATTWVIQTTPSPSGATEPAFAGASCPSATSCFAVGSDSNAVTTISQTLAEHWNGSTWATQVTPSLSGSLNADLAGIACPSATSCIAVGQNTNGSDLALALAEHWNGSTWKTQTVPNPSDAAAGSDLDGISCTSVTSCTAVGYRLINSGTQQPLAERWNGSTWTIQATPVPADADESNLDAVSCASATSCTAVGVFSGPSYLALLAEHWNGSTWAIQDAPNPNGANPDPESTSMLNGVSCSSATSCTAVGFSDAAVGIVEHPLAEHWNGSAWTIQTAPDPAGTNQNPLNAVSCVSSTACTAVGFAGVAATGSTSTLAEQWNGSSWTVQSTADPAGVSSSLFGISCRSSATCTAVGSSDDGALAEKS